MVRTGCCGGLIRVLLIMINSVFFLIGLTVFIVAAILRWGSASILAKLSGDDADVQSILNVSAIDAVSVALLALGSFVIFVSLFGLVGACCANKFFLFIYEAIIVALFVTHAVILTVGAVKSGDVETEFRRLLNNTINDLNSNQTSPDKVTAECHSLRILSDIFICCGYNGPQDFVMNTTYASVCCKEGTYKGCGDTIVSEIKTNGINIVVIPNFIILGFEFVIILLVPFLIGRIRRHDRRYLEDEGSINVKPTSYYNANYNRDY